jgi:sulfide dehydrogenase [flavocytochrome c] flavoprotein chain
MSQINRRDFIKAIAAASSASVLTVPLSACAGPGGAKGGKASVVVIGGGFGGATAAKYIKMMDPGINVTLIEPNKTYISCPLSNEVLSGERDIKTLERGYDGLKKRGVNLLQDLATAIDPVKKTVTTKGGKTLGYDALVMSPGIDLMYGGVEGYSEAVAEDIPHAWKAGPQTLVLKKQIESMADGDVAIIAVPPGPFRCPPGPYERASQIANYLSHHGKKKSKVLILDANDSFSKKPLFESAWKKLYGYGAGGMIEWVPGASDGKVVKIDPKTRTCYTGFGEHKGKVVNIIPPHSAGKIAKDLGIAKFKDKWCEVKPETMESIIHADIYPIGDACVGGDLATNNAFPKSAHMANTQAKVAAGAIVAKINGAPAPVPYYVNTCYSVVAPDYGFSVVHVYRVEAGKWVYVKEASGISRTDTPAVAAVPATDGKPAVEAKPAVVVPDIIRKLEAQYAEGWLDNIMADAFA